MGWGMEGVWMGLHENGAMLGRIWVRSQYVR